MEISNKFGFKLPSSNTDDIADINQISDNFRIIDNEMATEQFVKNQMQKGSSDKYASVITDTKNGTAVALTDISPIEHILRLKAKSKNLLDLKSIEKMSGTPTINKDVLTISGYMAQIYVDLQAGITYTFSAKSSRAGDYGGGVSIMFYNGTSNLGDAYNIYKADTLNPSYTFAMPQNANRIKIIFYGGTSTSNTSATYEKVMLELGATATGYTPFVDDVSTVNVKRFGKNLLNIADTVAISSETVSIDGDNIVLKNFGANHYGIKFTENLNLKVGETYTFSIKGITTHSTGGWGWRVNYQDGTQEELKHPPATYTIKKEIRSIVFYVAFGEMTTIQDIIISKPQIELGTKETDYEPYIEPTIYSINPDGTVEGIMSLYPTTTLIPDKEGVVLDVEYKVDTKKYIDKKFAELAAMIVNS